jgi:hypothetical protein
MVIQRWTFDGICVVGEGPKHRSQGRVRTPTKLNGLNLRLNHPALARVIEKASRVHDRPHIPQ